MNLQITKPQHDLFKEILKSVDSFNYYMACVNIDTNNIVVTDGRRLAIYPNITDHPSGQYTPIKIEKAYYLTPLQKEIGGTYPNYERILPNYIKDQTLNTEKFFLYKHNLEMEESRYILALSELTKTHFNISYLKALKGHIIQTIQHDQIETHPIQFNLSLNGTYIVMPLSKEGDK